MFKDAGKEPTKGRRERFFWVNRNGGYHKGDIINAEDYKGKTNYDYTDRPDKAGWIFVSINNPIPHYTIRDMGYTYEENENEEDYVYKKPYTEALAECTVYEVLIVPNTPAKYNTYNDEVLAKKIEIVQRLGKARSFLERDLRIRSRNKKNITYNYGIKDKLNLPPQTKVKDLGTFEYSGDYRKSNLTPKEKKFFDLYLEFRKSTKEEDEILSLIALGEKFSRLVKEEMGVLRKKDFPSLYHPQKNNLPITMTRKDDSEEIINPGEILISFLKRNRANKIRNSSEEFFRNTY